MTDFQPTMRQESGGRLIIASGLAFTISKDSGIDLFLNLDIKNQLIFRFSFENDGTNKPSIQSETNAQELKITCRNYNNPFGIGLTEALNIGTYEDKNIYLTFMIYGTETQKKLEYCFFIEQK